jgi:hypothetical protein
MTKTSAVILAALTLISVPAMAEDVSTTTLCKVLPVYKADPGVNYTPGTDVHGQMVVPGDLNKVMSNDVDAVEIPVEYNVLQNMNVNLPPGSQMRPTVAVLKVYHDGRVKYNDQDITQQAQNLCTLRQPKTSTAHVN